MAAPVVSAAKGPVTARLHVRSVAKPTTSISATPSATRPHWACPRERCLAIVDPPPVRRGSRYSLPLNPALLEGSGEKGGLDPADLTSAYKIPAGTSSPQTVAVIEAFGYAAAESDLAKYRERYGLPECTKANGCFKRINVKGEEANYPTESEEAQGWQGESALDMDMVSAACPSCQIMMVESTPEELELGVETAFNNGATEVSESFGGPEQFYCEAGFCTPTFARELIEFYSHPGVPVTVASGDFAYNNEEIGFTKGHSPSFPATVGSVIAVGGTQLRKEANSRGWGEQVWNDPGEVGFQTVATSGCSAWFERPSWQGPLATGCEHRLDNDVAANAECRFSPVSVYSSVNGGWGNFCGTSVSAPLVAGILAHASAAVRSAGARAFYEGSSVFDVTIGNDEFRSACTPILWCVAKTGYDGPTGNGTPDGVPVSVRPYVSKVEPTEGPESGGTSVTISGTGFEAGEAVYFGSAPATSVTIESPTSAKAVSPDGSGTVDVTLAGETVLDINRGDHFTYQARTDLSYSGPTRAVDAQTVTLTATLTEHASHNPIAGRVVEFAVGAEQCQATTNASGLASCAVQINDAPGSYTLAAKVGAGAGYEEATSNVGFTVIAPPIFGRCLPASSEKVNGKVIYHGEFTTSSCTVTSLTKEGKDEWHPGPGPKAHFALAIKPATTIKIETRGKHSLICTAATGEGSVTGFNTVQMGLVLRGCSEEGEICGNIGAGEVKIARLDGTLGWQNRALNKVDVALTLHPFLYECAEKAVLIEAASILLPVTVNKVSIKATDKFTESRGIQVPDQLEGGPMLSFEELRLTNYEPVTETFDETLEDAGLAATLLQTYEEGYEINTAF